MPSTLADTLANPGNPAPTSPTDATKFVLEPQETILTTAFTEDISTPRAVSLVDLQVLTGCTCASVDPGSGSAPPTVTVMFTITEIHSATVVAGDSCGAAGAGYEKGWEARSGAGRLGFGRLRAKRRDGQEENRVGKVDNRRKWGWIRKWR